MEIIIGVCVVCCINYFVGVKMTRKARKEGNLEGYSEGYQKGYSDGHELATVKARRDTLKWAHLGR